MNDKLKFHRMTNPVKFRTFKIIKRFFQTAGHNYGVVMSKINYLFNYILYKLNILKRYTNKDACVNVKCKLINGCLPQVYELSVEGEYFTGTVRSVVVEDVETDVDYFYYVDQRGLKHITHTVRNLDHHTFGVLSSLINPGIIIDGKKYVYGNVPQIVTTFKQPEIPLGAPFKETDLLSQHEALKPKVVKYDLTKLLNIRYKVVLGDSEQLDVTYATINAAVMESKNEIRRYLSNLTLHDLEV